MGGEDNSDKNEKSISSRDAAIFLLKIICLLILILFIGTLGFVIYEGTDWVDSFQNAAFILTTTGMVTITETRSGKIYSSIYNVITSIFVILVITILFTSGFQNSIA